ncbi:hypothetical protein GCM10009751_25130 [Myceligenerans crystallogenes]|uniref:Uncharacterized protein n=2 Tax=Myceligenerans crystallogenes TaxID=316335 RepID=A0ABP4ZRC9_9MICO
MAGSRAALLAVVLVAVQPVLLLIGRVADPAQAAEVDGASLPEVVVTLAGVLVLPVVVASVALVLLGRRLVVMAALVLTAAWTTAIGFAETSGADLPASVDELTIAVVLIDAGLAIALAETETGRRLWRRVGAGFLAAAAIWWGVHTLLGTVGPVFYLFEQPPGVFVTLVADAVVVPAVTVALVILLCTGGPRGLRVAGFLAGALVLDMVWALIGLIAAGAHPAWPVVAVLRAAALIAVTLLACHAAGSEAGTASPRVP